MKALVTGATGFLGTRLCKKLRQLDFEVVEIGSKNCDLTKDSSLGSFLKGREGDFDLIFHLAAWTQAGDFCLYHTGEQWRINQKINTNVLDYWAAKQPQAKMVCMGTSCSYDPALELREENYMSGTPIDSLFTYAMTKRMLYSGLLALNKQYGMKYLCLVPSTLYGPMYHTDVRQMHFIFDLIKKIVRAKMTGEKVVLWGDGHQKRELVYIDDFIDIMLTLNSRCDNELVNIGAGTEFSIRQFAGLICKHVGYDERLISYDTSRYVGAKSKCLSVDKLRRLYPDYRLTPLEDGLAKTVEWFWENRDKLV